MTEQGLGGSLAVHNINVLDLEFVEGGADVFRAFVHNGTSERIGQDTTRTVGLVA